MGFFTDLKEDLSQAVNELVPDEQDGRQGKAKPAEPGAMADDFASEEEIWAENENWADEDWEEEIPEEVSKKNDMAERLSSMLEKLDEQEMIPEEEETEETGGMGILGVAAPGRESAGFSADELMAETGLTEAEMQQMGLAVPETAPEAAVWPDETEEQADDIPDLFATEEQADDIPDLFAAKEQADGVTDLFASEEQADGAADLFAAEEETEDLGSDSASVEPVYAMPEVPEVTEAEPELPETAPAEAKEDEEEPAQDEMAETGAAAEAMTAVDILRSAETQDVAEHIEAETESEAGGESAMLGETVTMEEMTGAETAAEDMAVTEEVQAGEETAPEEESAAMDAVSQRVVSDEVAVVTAGMKIVGDVTSDGSLEVVGMVKGNIDIWGKLNIAGTVNGNSKAMEVYAENARINGEITSEGSVKIGQSSVIIGNIYATSAVIAGAVKGDIDVQGPVILDTTAIVMGNIKSKSVQINNGAVIEGMCSLAYADVNPTSFFEAFQ